MKKVLPTILVGAMLLAMGTTAFATTVTDFADKTEITVNGTFNASETETIYSVNIEWGSMNFTYNEEQKQWNPETHTYGTKTAASWSHEDGANKITVTNHSNAGVHVGLSYTSATGSAVTGDFYQTDEEDILISDFVLISAVDTVHANAPTEDAYLQVGGTLTSAQNGATIGEITVSLQTENKG